METRGRRGSRAPIETAAPDREPISEPTDAVPAIASPSVSEPAALPVADDPDTPDRASLTALAIAEEALAHAPESPPQSSPGSLPGFSGGKPAALPAADDFYGFGREALAAFAQSQAALARGLAVLGIEITGLAQSEFATASRTATRLLAVRTLSDAMMLQADYARTSLEAAVAGAARLSDLGVKLATEAAEPLVTQLGKSWLKAARLAG
jgi:hypothetical protein